ncbi:protein-tyrosine phosphatase-like protein [Russula vinacea]|nr:protein-tyrosine phosphatase-like protein [Russula vinacea]
MVPVADGEHVTRSGFMYRSGELAGVTQHGKGQLRALGVTTIFDLRSDAEIAKYDSATPQIAGVTVFVLRCLQKRTIARSVWPNAFNSTQAERRRCGPPYNVVVVVYPFDTLQAFMQLYSEILDAGGPAFGAILRHVRDSPNDAFIFHCTAGKDRTGIAAALLLLLAGASTDAISADYALTRIGRAPMRPVILSRLAREPLLPPIQPLLTICCPQADQLGREETMQAFVKMLGERYGGVKEYVRRTCGLTDQDIAIIRQNLLTPKS